MTARRGDGPLLGATLELQVGAVAHGGHCVARHEGRVLFVRHTLPGERVRARVTEDHGGSFCRADAIEILDAAPGRVSPPCPFSGPGKCGGCDWQHADPATQRALKGAVVADALHRIGGLPLHTVEVAELPGGPLRWRSRAQFTVDRSGRVGLRRHRSHTVQPLQDCLLVPEPAWAAVAKGSWPRGSTVQVVRSGSGEIRVEARSRRRPESAGEVVHEKAAGRAWTLHSSGFWQVHPAAADALTDCVREFLRPLPGDRLLDLYSGVGLFAGALAAQVKSVVAVESDPGAADDARASLADLANVHTVAEPVTAELIAATPFDAAVLDPPRKGAGPQVMAALCDAGPRALVYVACDPAALARDLKTAAEHGYRLAGLRAFDLFPMTHHVECVALLEPAQG